MKKVYPVIILCLFCLLATKAIAQNDSAAQEKPKEFTFVEESPQFPGGDGALIKWIQNNINYRNLPENEDANGKVLLRFVVMEDGSIQDINVVRGVSPGMDKEAVRVAGTFPKFTPGKQQGKPVRVYFNLPIVFKSY